MSQQPFDDIRALLRDMPASQAPPHLTGLGALTPTAAWIAAWRGGFEVNRPILALYAGAHMGVSDAFDARAQLEAIAAGGALSAKAAQHLGAGLDVFDLAIDRPVPDFTRGATMSEREAAATMAFGMEALAKQPDLLLLSAFGPGTGEAAAALLQGLGFGDGEARARAAVDRALAEGPADPLNLMRQLGGRETAALAGAILAARIQRTPVLLGGLTALAAAAVLSKIDHAAIAHCRAATADPYARAIGLQSVCEEDLGLTDGAEALAALMQVRLACALAA